MGMADSGVEFIEEFHKFLSVERGLADTTVVTYLHHVPAYLKFLNNAPTTSITAESALAYFEGLRRRGPGRAHWSVRLLPSKRSTEPPKTLLYALASGAAVYFEANRGRKVKWPVAW